MVKATKEFFARYVDFKGRTSRADFWWAVLGVFLISFVVGIVCSLLGGTMTATESVDPAAYFSNAGNIIYVIWCLVLILPGIAICVRRLHDTNKSGWLYLLNLIPFIGGIILFVFYLLPAVDEGNNY